MFVVPRGELDILTADDFRRTLESATDRSTTLIVDLIDLDFCGAAGLRVFADVARRLSERGGGLSLWSPSATLAKLLNIVGLQDLVTVPGSRRSAASPALNDEQFAGTIAGLGRLASDALVDATMRMVATFAQRLGVAVEAASVTMCRRGRLVTVAATHPIATDLDDVQYDAGGPCVDAATHGRVAHCYVGGDDSEWDALRDAAQEAGFNAVLSTPFSDNPQLVAAALNLYSRSRELGETDGELASLLVGEAARVLAVHPLDRRDVSERLTQGLADRDRIARAQGIMMERHDLSAA
ncbi:MAG: anti-sigma factor antagonist, partial [Acidimicrobiales bacterium]